MSRIGSETDKIVAVLHDVIEDTPVTIEDLHNKGFSKAVLEAIDCLTKLKDEETYDEFTERCKSNPIALRVKIADLEDNMDIRRFDELTERDLERLKRFSTLRGIRRLIETERTRSKPSMEEDT